MALNLDQTQLTYVSLGRQTFDLKDLIPVPIKGIDNKRQMTATFTVSVSGSFLPIQLIFNAKTKHCFPK